jgi:hypothetical protein
VPRGEWDVLFTDLLDYGVLQSYVHGLLITGVIAAKCPFRRQRLEHLRPCGTGAEGTTTQAKTTLRVAFFRTRSMLELW